MWVTHLELSSLWSLIVAAADLEIGGVSVKANEFGDLELTCLMCQNIGSCGGIYSGK